MIHYHNHIIITILCCQGVHMMELSSSEAGQPSLVPADMLGEPVEGDIVEYSPDGSLVAIVTSQSKGLK